MNIELPNDTFDGVAGEFYDAIHLAIFPTVDVPPNFITRDNFIKVLQ